MFKVTSGGQLVRPEQAVQARAQNGSSSAKLPAAVKREVDNYIHYLTDKSRRSVKNDHTKIANILKAYRKRSEKKDTDLAVLSAVIETCRYSISTFLQHEVAIGKGERDFPLKEKLVMICLDQHELNVFTGKRTREDEDCIMQVIFGLPGTYTKLNALFIRTIKMDWEKKKYQPAHGPDLTMFVKTMVKHKRTEYLRQFLHEFPGLDLGDSLAMSMYEKRPDFVQMLWGHITQQSGLAVRNACDTPYESPDGSVKVTAIFMAVQQKNHTWLQQCLSQYPDLDVDIACTIDDTEDCSALEWAHVDNDQVATRALIAYGASPLPDERLLRAEFPDQASAYDSMLAERDQAQAPVMLCQSYCVPRYTLRKMATRSDDMSDVFYGFLKNIGATRIRAEQLIDFYRFMKDYHGLELDKMPTKEGDPQLFGLLCARVSDEEQAEKLKVFQYLLEQQDLSQGFDCRLAMKPLLKQRGFDPFQLGEFTLVEALVEYQRPTWLAKLLKTVQPAADEALNAAVARAYVRACMRGYRKEEYVLRPYLTKDHLNTEFELKLEASATEAGGVYQGHIVGILVQFNEVALLSELITQMPDLDVDIPVKVAEQHVTALDFAYQRGNKDVMTCLMTQTRTLVDEQFLFPEGDLSGALKHQCFERFIEYIELAQAHARLDTVLLMQGQLLDEAGVATIKEKLCSKESDEAILSSAIDALNGSVPSKAAKAIQSHWRQLKRKDAKFAQVAATSPEVAAYMQANPSYFTTAVQQVRRDLSAFNELCRKQHNDEALPLIKGIVATFSALMNLNIVFETGIEYQASPLYALQSGNMGTFQYLCQCYQAGCEAENPSGHTAQHLLKTILAHSVEATQVFADAHTVAQLNAMLPAAFLHMGICPSTQAFRQAIVRKSERSKVSVPTLYIDGAVKQGGFQAQCLPSCFDDLDSFNTYLGHCRASTDAALLTGVKQMVATKASKSQIIAVIKAWPKEAKSAAGVKAFNTHCKALAKLNVKPASKQPVHVVDDENIAATLSAIASSNGQKEPSYVLTARIHLAQIKASEKTVHQIFMTNPSFFHHLLEAGNLDEQFDTIRMIATTQGLQLFQRLCPQGYSLPIDFASKNKHFDTSQKTLRFVFEKTKELADSNPDFDRNRLQISYNNAFMNSDDMFLLLDEVLEAECRAKLYNDALHSGRMVIADRLYPSLTADIVNEVIFLEDCSTTCTIASLINSGKPDIAGALIDRFSGALDLNVTLIQSVAGGATIRTLSTVALRRGYTDLATRIDAAELPQESSMQRLAFTDERIADVSISVPDYLVEYMPDISGQYSYQQLVNLQQALRDAPHLIHGLLAAPSMNQEQVLIQMKIAALLFRRELETEPEPLESARIPFEIAMQNDCLSEGPIKPYLLAETLKAVAARSSEGVAVQLLQRVVGSFEAESDLQPVVMAIREELSEEMMKFFALSNVIDDKRLWAALFTEVKKDPTRTLGKEPDVLDIVDIIAEAGRTDTMQLFLSENPNYDLNQKKLACETGAKADAVQETSLLFLEAQKGNTAMMTLFLLHGARPMTEPQYVTLSFAQKRSYIASIANTRIDELFEAVWPLHTQLPSRRQQRRNKEVLALRSEFSRIEARLKVLEKEKSAKLDMQAAAAQLSPSQKQLFKTQFKAFESKPHPWSAQDIQAYKALIKQYQSAAETLESVENTMDQIEGNKLAYEQQLAREAEQAAELQNHHRRQAALLAGAVSRMFDDRLRAQHVASARVLAHAVRVYHDARRPAQPVQVPVAVEEQRPTSTIAEDDTNATGDTHSEAPVRTEQEAVAGPVEPTLDVDEQRQAVAASESTSTVAEDDAIATGDTHSEVAVSHEPEVENGPVQVPTVTEEKQQQPVVATAGPTVVVAEEQASTTSTAQPVMPVETGPVPVQPHLAQVQQLPPLIFSIVPSGPHDPPLMNQNALQHYQAMEQQIHALQQHAWRLEMNNSAMLGHIQAIQHSFQAKLKGFADTLSAVLGDYSLVLKNDEGKEGGKTVEQLQSFSSQSLPRLLGPVGYEPALRLTDIRTSVKTFLMGYSSRLSGTSPKDAVEKYKVGQLVQNFEELAAEQDVLNPRAY